jgi:hypothetical protein
VCGCCSSAWCSTCSSVNCLGCVLAWHPTSLRGELSHTHATAVCVVGKSLSLTHTKERENRGMKSGWHPQSLLSIVWYNSLWWCAAAATTPQPCLLGLLFPFLLPLLFRVIPP